MSSVEGDPKVWPHQRDVILYARSSYYYDNMKNILSYLKSSTYGLKQSIMNNPIIILYMCLGKPTRIQRDKHYQNHKCT